MRDSTVGLQRVARERADEQARRIPWQRLYEVRKQYIDWQEFYLWARSIFEIEKRIPDSLADILQDRCPGFLEAEKALTLQSTQDPASGAPPGRLDRRSCLRLRQAGRLVNRNYVLRDTGPTVSASRSLLVGMYREMEESQTGPVSVVRGVERYGDGV